jgi:hypothetical protein
LIQEHIGKKVHIVALIPGWKVDKPNLRIIAVE